MLQQKYPEKLKKLKVIYKKLKLHEQEKNII